MAEAPKEPAPVVEEEPVIDSFEANPDPDGSDMPVLPPKNTYNKNNATSTRNTRP